MATNSTNVATKRIDKVPETAQRLIIIIICLFVRKKPPETRTFIITRNNKNNKIHKNLMIKLNKSSIVFMLS